MSQSIVSTRGRVTIPADIRKRLGLKAHDQVKFMRLIDGTVVIKAEMDSLIFWQRMLKQQEGLASVAVLEMRTGRN